MDDKILVQNAQSAIKIIENSEKDKRYFTTKLVSYGVELDHSNMRQLIKPHALKIANNSGPIPILKDHVNTSDNIIGNVLYVENKDDGLYGTGFVRSDTEQAKNIENGISMPISIGYKTHAGGYTISKTTDSKRDLLTVNNGVVTELSFVGVGRDSTAQVSVFNAADSFNPDDIEGSLSNYFTDEELQLIIDFYYKKLDVSYFMDKISRTQREKEYWRNAYLMEKRKNNG